MNIYWYYVFSWRKYGVHNTANRFTEVAFNWINMEIKYVNLDFVSDYYWRHSFILGTPTIPPSCDEPWSFERLYFVFGPCLPICINSDRRMALSNHTVGWNDSSFGIYVTHANIYIYFSIGFVFCCRTNKQTNLQICIHKL